MHRDVQAASHLIEGLARRIGHVAEGDPITRATRQQRWSPFNVPLFWAAAGTEGTTPVLEWMIQTNGSDSMEFQGGRVSNIVAATQGWTALREVFRSWGILSSED